MLLLSCLLFSSYEHCLNARLGAVTGVRAVTSSYIEEMIKELVQPEGLEVSASCMISEGTTTVTGETSSQSSLPKNLPTLDPQLGKRIKIPEFD